MEDLPGRLQRTRRLRRALARQSWGRHLYSKRIWGTTLLAVLLKVVEKI